MKLITLVSKNVVRLGVNDRRIDGSRDCSDGEFLTGVKMIVRCIV